MEITKEQIERMVRSRMPFGLKSKRGKMLFPFKTVEMFEKTIDCLSNGIYEELSQLNQNTVSDQNEQFYCVSSNALVYGKPCEKWCGDKNCKTLCDNKREIA
jgi:hypothetical protein